MYHFHKFKKFIQIFIKLNEVVLSLLMKIPENYKSIFKLVIL